MASAANPSNRVYDDFDPTFEWANEDGADILLLFLPGFRKEQIKVQITSARNLRVTGERQVGDNRWSRFRKEMPIKPNYDSNKISSKYENGILFVKHMKTIATLPKGPRQDVKPAAESSQPPKGTAPVAPKEQKQKGAIKKPEEGQKPREKTPDVSNFTEANLPQKGETSTASDNTKKKMDRKPDDSGAGARKKKGLVPPPPCLNQVLLKPTSYKQAIGNFMVNLKKPRNLITAAAAVLLVVVIGLSVKTAIKSLGQLQTSRPQNSEL